MRPAPDGAAHKTRRFIAVTGKNAKRLAALVLATLVFLLPLLTAGAQDPGTLRVRCFKIGKADAFLLRMSRHAVLIDAGEDDDAPEILDYLADNGITELDCLILTHFDKRSIGGAQELLYNYLPLREAQILTVNRG